MLWRRDVRHKDEAPNRHNILANSVPFVSRRKRRKRLASQATEPCGNMSFVHTFMLAYDGNLSLLEINLCRKGSSLFSASAATKKCAPPFGVRIFLLWRRRRDSNPRGLAPKRFSRPPRYDRFDTPPYAAIIAERAKNVNGGKGSAPQKPSSAAPRFCIERQSMPCCSLYALTVFCKSMVTVMGPTPPGTGVM